MEKGLRALFYEYKYYLLPDGLTLDEVKLRGTIALTRLREELCMAPNFIYESMCEETLTVEAPERAFETTVNLYTHAEYDEILLGAVKRVCAGCECYMDTDDVDLNGHHREIALSGSCYLRHTKDESPSAARCAQWFWSHVAVLLNDLSACIDQGDQAKLNAILEEPTRRVSYPIRYYGTISQGQYCLCMSAERAYSSDYCNVLSYLAMVANSKESELNAAGWKVYPYFPKNVFRYQGTKSYRDDEPVLSLLPIDISGKYAVAIYHTNASCLSDEAENELINETSDRIREKIGEDKELAILAGYTIGTDEEHLCSLNEICEKLENVIAKYEAEDDGDELPHATFPHMYPYAMREPLAIENALPYKRYVLSGMTSACECSFLEQSELETERWWTEFYSYAYLVFPVEGDATELMRVVGWYISNLELVPEPIRVPDDKLFSAMTVGFGETESYVFVDNLVYDEQRFFRTLRIIAPVLRSYRTRVVMVNKDGVTSYLCDYEFTPEEGMENKL